MQLIEIQTKTDAKRFITGPVSFLKNLPNYIHPLESDIEKVFDTQKNKAFRHGECIRWILVDQQNQFIGRIAAFVNNKYKNKGDTGKAGGIGFFDCIDDQNAADILFNVAKDWLMKKGCYCMDGPINFGERDKWWGLVISGHQPPLYNMNFNPPYYKDLFENYGFKVFFNQLCFGIDPEKKFNPKVYERHEHLVNDGGYKFQHIELNNIPKYAADFASVYNAAWAKHGGMKEMKVEHAVLMFKTMKPVIDPKIVWFVYHHEKPIAIFINLPDLNQWFKKLEGKFDLLSKLKFLFYKKTIANTKMVGLVFGIIPEYQGLGIDSYMIVEAGKSIQQLSYKKYEMQWIGDFNPKMINIAKNFGETFETRKLATYRYIFDQSIPFTRHPLID